MLRLAKRNGYQNQLRLKVYSGTALFQLLDVRNRIAHTL